MDTFQHRVTEAVEDMINSGEKPRMIRGRREAQRANGMPNCSRKWKVFDKYFLMNYVINGVEQQLYVDLEGKF